MGLGNPGSEYEQTRHNVGFWLADRIAARHKLSFKRPFLKPYEHCHQKLEGDNSISIVKPLTYINRSGEIFGSNRDFLPSENTFVMILCDQMDIPAGSLRLKANGGTAGHNGLKSITSVLGDNFFPLYIGIGRPPTGVDVIGHVLGSPSEADLAEISNALDRALVGVDLFIEKNPNAAMSFLNVRSNREENGEKHQSH